MDKETFDNLLIERVLAEHQALPMTKRYRFSRKFTKAINNILHPDSLMDTSKPIRLSKLVLIAAIMVFSMAMVAAGTSFMHRMFEIKYVDGGGTITPVFTTSTSPGTSIFTPESPPYIPDGYVMIGSTTTDMQHTEFYRHETGYLLVFDKFPLNLSKNQYRWISVDSDGPTTEELIGDIPVTKVEQSEYYFYLWNNHTSFYMLQISRTLDMNTIHKVLEAIILK